MSSVSIDTGVTLRISSWLPDKIESKRFLFCEKFCCALSVIIFIASFSALALFFPEEKLNFAVAAEFASPGVVDSDRVLLPNQTNEMLCVPSVKVFELRSAHHFSVRMLVKRRNEIKKWQRHTICFLTTRNCETNRFVFSSMEEIICDMLSSSRAAFLAECSISRCDESMDSCREDICRKEKKKVNINIWIHCDHYIAPSNPRPKLTFDHDNCPFSGWKSEKLNFDSSSASSTEGFIFICPLKIRDGRLRVRVVVVVVELRSFLWGMIDSNSTPSPARFRVQMQVQARCAYGVQLCSNNCESWVKQKI